MKYVLPKIKDGNNYIFVFQKAKECKTKAYKDPWKLTPTAASWAINEFRTA